MLENYKRTCLTCLFKEVNPNRNPCWSCSGAYKAPYWKPNLLKELMKMPPKDWNPLNVIKFYHNGKEIGVGTINLERYDKISPISRFIKFIRRLLKYD